MKMLDLFCGQGGCSMGYWQTGKFDKIVGIDINPQKRYPFDFVQDDALDYCRKYGQDFDFIHTSPPCQEYSKTKSLKTKDYPDLIAETRAVLRATGKPYVIENVPGAPLVNPIMLCGSFFGLGVVRHRLFEIFPEKYILIPVCSHEGKTQPRGSIQHRGLITITGHNFRKAEASQAVSINWMSSKGLAQAIPPAYTRFIGERILA